MTGTDRILLRATMMFMCILLVSNCAPKLTQIQPDYTSYPRDRVTEKPQSAWLAPGVEMTYRSVILQSGNSKPLYRSSGFIISEPVTYDYVRQEIGDTSEQEVWIFPIRKSDYSEKAISQWVPRRGKEVCTGEYRISESKYYNGDEATIALIGNKSPALRVLYRCSVYEKGKERNAEERLLRELSVNLTDAPFFDILEKRYDIPAEKLTALVRAVADREGIPITREGKSGEVFLLAGGLQPNKMRWGRIEQLAAVIRPEKVGSTLLFILPAFQLTYHSRGVLDVTVENKGAAPWNRKIAYKRAVDFLSYIETTR